MPKAQAMIISILFVAALLVMAGQPFYVLSEGQQAVITQFGDPVGQPIKNAGLHMKVPFIHKVNRFEKRLLRWDGEPTKNPTQDKRFIWIDSTARWRIVDPLKFMQTVGNEFLALSRLSAIIESQTKTVVSGQPLIEIVRFSDRTLSRQILDETSEADREAITDKIHFGRETLTRDILERCKNNVANFGVELVDMRLKRINYTTEVREKIYERMIAERRRAAEQFRSEGQGQKAQIDGRMERELKRIESEAYRTAQEMKGKADAEATGIYAAAYTQDPDFYDFMKSLETYKHTVDANSTLVLTTDSEYFKYLKALTAQ